MIYIKKDPKTNKIKIFNKEEGKYNDNKIINNDNNNKLSFEDNGGVITDNEYEVTTEYYQEKEKEKNFN